MQFKILYVCQLHDCDIMMLMLIYTDVNNKILQINLYMLRSFMENGIGSNVYGGLIVTKE